MNYGTFQGKQIIKRIEFDSYSGRTYIICLLDDGSYSCSCPSWKFCRAPKKDCKHILEVKNNKKEYLDLNVEELK